MVLSGVFDSLAAAIEWLFYNLIPHIEKFFDDSLFLFFCDHVLFLLKFLDITAWH